MNLSKQSKLVLVVMMFAVMGVVAGVSRGKGSSNSEAIQDPGSLDRRISSLEQRFYQVESSISRLQTYIATQRPPAPPPSSSDREISLLREEVQKLSLRLGEVECGLAKLDERTTTRKSGAGKSADPCRLNPDTPVRLSARP